MDTNMTVLGIELESVSANLSALQINADQFFLLVMACLVFFMQCGFAFLEAGSVRSKNTTNILIKNVLDVWLGAFAYWAMGYAFAFGGGNAFIGYRHFFFEGFSRSLMSHWFFHFVFAATAATIVSGAMAERTEFAAYLIYSFLITGFVYPVVSHWAWADNGWLLVGPGNGISYQDFAGSGVVHVVGGMAALVGAVILGPRIGRFENGKPVTGLSGHTVPLVALGGFILMFGFLAFNGGSQASISQPGDGYVVAIAIVNTVISGSLAALTSLTIRRMGLSGGGQWSLLTTINGALTGMVAICAGCCCVYAWGAAIIGVLSGIIYIVVSWLVLKAGIDDPLDAVAVHMGGGVWGVLSAPILAVDTGIVFNISSPLSWEALGWNFAGLAAIMGWTAIISILLFGVMKFAGILRVEATLELKGLDIPKHGEPAYPIESYGHGWGSMGMTLLTAPVNGTETSPVSGVETVRMNGIDNQALVMDHPTLRETTPVKGSPKTCRSIGVMVNMEVENATDQLEVDETVSTFM
ncbi:ammonium transporter-like protein [Saccoglossus kowalevskii]|uniref:Ammonium transporter n=1 Tax=Saccoglossus kowalevskii TaxID=10224 RepID=D1LWW0_SACKO|nr:ammonium transporter-like protein [Saccoglossus kowalevskii]ACY92466.1 ammonium transporter-like protein [Saccoglossus kowalevskii]